MYDYEYENNVLLFLRLLKFLHTDQPEVLEEIIKDYPMAGDEDIEMIMNELMLTVFDEGAPDDEDDMVTVRFSHDYIDRLYAQGCKDGGLFPFRINAWQEKIKDIFLFYVADASYSVFDVRYHFSGTNVKLDITLSPDCCTPMFFYPFSNVHDNERVCTGNNILPRYKKLSAMKNFPRYLLGLPDNDDMFYSAHNQKGLDHKALLEHLKDKDPSYYYTDILVPNGRTLSDFVLRR